MNSDTYLSLTPAERNARAKLTSVEQLLVNEFIKAAKALPKSICISVDDMADAGEPTLLVSKRITPGSAQRVAALRKKSLVF